MSSTLHGCSWFGPWRSAAALAFAALMSASPVRANAVAPPPVVALSELQEVEAWLDAEPDEVADVAQPEGLEAPLLAPRQHGLVIETGLGALGHVGSMNNVSPASPLFRLQLGYEPWNWLMLLAQTDLCLSDTRYASRSVESRPYALFGGGVGMRLSWQALSHVAFSLQGDAGLSTVDGDVLASHGYRQAERLRLYYSAVVGIDWFQVSPHHALRFFGGARSYQRTFRRVEGDPRPWAWLGGVSLRYTL